MKCKNCNHKVEYNSFWGNWEHITDIGYNDNFCYNKGKKSKSNPLGYCCCDKPEPI